MMRIVGVFTVCVLALGSAAWSQGVGGNSPTQTEHVFLSAVGIPENPLAWWARVGSAQNPVPVELDPGGAAWRAGFRTEVGQAIAPSHISLIDEFLSVDGTLPWTGWQMQILTSDFNWSTQWLSPAFDVRVNGVRAPGLQVELLGTIARASFDPLSPGTVVQIRALTVYEGAAAFADSLRVEQFPTPEPTTPLGFLLLTLLIRRR